MEKIKPYVLITNDDGIDSPGLHALVEALLPLADILVVAPKDQQTNMGRGSLRGKDIGTIEPSSITIGDQQIYAFAVNGSPAQSVAHALLELTELKPDYCISGINYGENLGLAFTCSGTLGAAFEADSFGIPSIAFSRTIPLVNQRSSDFETMEWDDIIFHIRAIFKSIIDNGLPEKVRILNVNFPDGIKSNTEVRVTKQAYMSYGQYIKPDKRIFDKGYHLEWQLNENIHKVETDTDIYAMHVDKVISVTPISSLMSIDFNEEHKEWFSNKYLENS